jgi:hypothetical protein
MNWLLDRIFRGRLQHETERYLRQLALSSTLKSRENATELLNRLTAGPGPSVTLGETAWGEPVTVPLNELVRAYGLVTGSSGSGKSFLALLILKSLMESFPQGPTMGFGSLMRKAIFSTGRCFCSKSGLNTWPSGIRKQRRNFAAESSSTISPPVIR